MKLSIGIFLHKTQFTECFFSEDRQIVEFVKYLTNEQSYESFLKRVKHYLELGYEVLSAIESTANARYFRNKLLVTGVPVKVVNTLRFEVVNESVKKTDRHDAKTLAEFLEKDMLPESVLCSQESEDIRRVLKSRSILVKTLISIKNQIHGLLLGYGIETKRGKLQSKRERQRILVGLADHRINGNTAKTVEPLFEKKDQLSLEVKKLEKVLEELVENNEVVELLETISGIGLITAATIRAYTDDISRYDSGKKYAAHAGLVPWVQNSNMTVHHGKITKRGPVELRTAFVQVVMSLVRTSKKTAGYRVVKKYRSMKTSKGSGRSIIATARKMSTIIFHMLNTMSLLIHKKWL